MPGGTGPCSSCCNSCFNRAHEQVRNRQRVSHLSATDSVDDDEYNSQVWDGPSGPYLQQVMPGWQARLTWCQISNWLLVLALLNGGLVCVSYFSWTTTTETSWDYTECANSTGQICRLTLEVKSSLTKPVYLYYGMSGAYFNHRWIQTGWNMRQILGLPYKGNLTKMCKEHAYRMGKEVLPCGPLPNAIFNDTIQIWGPFSYENSTLTAINESAIPQSADGITWLSFIHGLYRPLSEDKMADTVQPISWPKPIAQRYKRPFSDAEDLHIWLRTPAFSDFRKTSYRLPDGLSAGKYHLVIGYNYPVQGFGGKKQLIIAEKSLMGGKNYVPLILFMTTTGSYLFLAVATFIRGLMSGQCGIRKSVLV